MRQRAVDCASCCERNHPTARLLSAPYLRYAGRRTALVYIALLRGMYEQPTRSADAIRYASAHMIDAMHVRLCAMTYIQPCPQGPCCTTTTTRTDRDTPNIASATAGIATSVGQGDSSQVFLTPPKGPTSCTTNKGDKPCSSMVWRGYWVSRRVY